MGLGGACACPFLRGAFLTVWSRSGIVVFPLPLSSFTASSIPRFLLYCLAASLRVLLSAACASQKWMLTGRCAALDLFPSFASCLCQVESFHVLQLASSAHSCWNHEAAAASDSSILPHIGTKSRGTVRSVCSHVSSMELKPVEVACDDVCLVVLCGFPELAPAVALQRRASSPALLLRCAETAVHEPLPASTASCTLP